MDWNTVRTHFESEISDAIKYKGIANRTEGCNHQVLIDMAWEEYTHAKHLLRMMKEHGVDAGNMDDMLFRTKETLSC